ncbi:MAG: SDR family oxidoreductase, partial [Comamonas sp.]
MTFDTSTPMNPQGRLAGKTVFITGAGSVGPGWGNGRAMALRFAQEGASVYGVDRDAARLVETSAMIEQIGGSFVAGTCDVTSSASIEQAISACHERFGRLDVLVNNVGGSAKGGPIEMSEDVWDAQVDHNLKSVFLTCKHALPIMLAQGSGNIINIASTHSSHIIPGCFPYPVAKHGLLGLTRALGIEYAPKGIRVNAIAPGYIETQLNVDYWNGFPDPHAERQRAFDLHPPKRIGQPVE